MILAVTVVFLNEERLLPGLLDSIAGQTRLPDRLMLVDDGSDDASPAIARRFAERHSYAQSLHRPRRSREGDRLAGAAELRAFQWAVEQVQGSYDVIAKLDADLKLAPQLFERILSAFESDPRLGIAGASLSVPGRDGEWTREYSAPWHIRGATKFYRRECYRQIAPLPSILGWDTIDEVRALMRDWRIMLVPMPDADSLHLRVTGTYDGALRGFHRRGMAAWGYGADPLNVVGSALVRMRERPRVLGGLAYAVGWLTAAVRRAPRAEPEAVRFMRREQRRRIWAILAGARSR